VNNTAVYEIECRNWKTDLPSWAFGSAVVINEEFPNQLHVSFSEFGGCGEFGFLCSGSGKSSENSGNSFEYAGYELSENYRVAETDYENYTIVTTCWNLSDGGHREIVYLMVRDRNWPSQNQPKIQELLYKITQWGLHIDSLTLTKQNDCEKWADQDMP